MMGTSAETGGHEEDGMADGTLSMRRLGVDDLPYTPAQGLPSRARVGLSGCPAPHRCPDPEADLA